MKTLYTAVSGLKTVDILNEQNEFFRFNEVSSSA